MNKILNAGLENRLGCTIEFLTNDTMVMNDKLSMIYNSKTYYFEVIDIKITQDKLLSIKAKEVGYWCNEFKRMKDFDLRNILDLEVCLIKDKDKIAQIDKESCWC